VFIGHCDATTVLCDEAAGVDDGAGPQSAGDDIREKLVPRTL
jgi:hypothetical protein